MRKKDRELQIRLVELQMKQERLTSDHMGFVAIGFGISIGFVSFLFALGINYKPEYDLLIYSLFGFGIMVAISMGFVVWHYEKKQEELKQEIENLRKEYI